MKCYQCPKPMMYQYGEQNIPLCLDCYHKVHQISQDQIENCERMAQAALNDMEMISGVTLPNRRELPPRRTVNLGGVSLHNIKVDNSNVGSINTGTIGEIGSIDLAITSIQNDNTQVAEALIELSQAVVNSTSVNEEQRKELVELLSAIATEASTPKERRKTAVGKTLLSRLKEITGIANDLTKVWEQWGPIISQVF